MLSWIGGAPEQEEAEHVRVDFVHATILERYLGFVNTETLAFVSHRVDICCKLTPVFVSCSLIKIKKRL